MPLCLIQSLPGTVHPLTDSLSVVVPDMSKEIACGVPVSRRKEVREGRCAWHSDSIQTSEPLSIDTLATLCAQWRDRGLFSFIELRWKGALGGAETDYIQRLAHVVDWLIVDGSSEAGDLPGELAVERWNRLVLQLRQVTRKVGLRLELGRTLPEEALRPWIAQLALQLGEPGFLFVEGATVEESVASIRGVQDILYHHSLSKGSARFVPIVRSVTHVLGDRTIELLDVPSLDALAMESVRPFFGGVAVVQGEGEPLFDRSLWQTIVRMITERCSVASLCCCDGIPSKQPSELIRQIYALGLTIQQEECQEALASLERLWEAADQEMLFGGENAAAVRELVEALIEQAHKIVSGRGVIKSLSYNSK
jgi:hypothetical protein